MQKVSKFKISGRLNGAEMARSESFKEEEFLCQLFIDIDYQIGEEFTQYGKLEESLIMKGRWQERIIPNFVGQQKTSIFWWKRDNRRPSDKK